MAEPTAASVLPVVLPVQPQDKAAAGPVVVVGSGHAGVAFVNALRRAGSSHEIVLLSAEPELPYERPPLSKNYLHGTQELDSLRFHTADYYDHQGIELRLGVKVDSIDPVDDLLHLHDGTTLDFGALVLATGGTPRRLKIPGADLAGVVSLYSRDDADQLRALTASARSPMLVGAGFIGLEVAAALAARGGKPIVVDVAERVMARVVSAPVSAYFEARHQEAGIQFELSAGVTEIRGVDGKVNSVVLADGRELSADAVVIGAGMVPNDQLAAGAGIAVADGVLVDETLQTSRPRVHAIGDCARLVNAEGASVRIESVQNATDQAKCLAQSLTGSATSYAEVPWFWSHQGSLKLQIAGLPQPADRCATRGDVGSGRFSHFWYHNGRLLYAESVNHVPGHMLARRLLSAGRSPDPAQIEDENVETKVILAS